jgi:hypothetical protein
MNHYTLEGLAHQLIIKRIAHFSSTPLSTALDYQNASASPASRTKNGVKVLSHKLSGHTKLEQGLELLQLGAWITYYLAEENQVDPIKIPWVDWFKKALK